MEMPSRIVLLSFLNPDVCDSGWPHPQQLLYKYSHLGDQTSFSIELSMTTLTKIYGIEAIKNRIVIIRKESPGFETF